MASATASTAALLPGILDAARRARISCAALAVAVSGWQSRGSPDCPPRHKHGWRLFDSAGQPFGESILRIATSDRGAAGAITFLYAIRCGAKRLDGLVCRLGDSVASARNVLEASSKALVHPTADHERGIGTSIRPAASSSFGVIVSAAAGASQYGAGLTGRAKPVPGAPRTGAGAELSAAGLPVTWRRQSPRHSGLALRERMESAQIGRAWCSGLVRRRAECLKILPPQAGRQHLHVTLRNIAGQFRAFIQALDHADERQAVRLVPNVLNARDEAPWLRSKFGSAASWLCT